MNCPSRTDNTDGREGWNQNPNALEGATREDLNGRTNARLLRRLSPDGLTDEVSPDEGPDAPTTKKTPMEAVEGVGGVSTDDQFASNVVTTTSNTPHNPYSSGGGSQGSRFQKIKQTLEIYGGFIGPGFMVSVFRHETVFIFLSTINYTPDSALPIYLICKHF